MSTAEVSSIIQGYTARPFMTSGVHVAASMGMGEFVEQLAARALPQALARQRRPQQIATDVLQPRARGRGPLHENDGSSREGDS